MRAGGRCALASRRAGARSAGRGGEGTEDPGGLGTMLFTCAERCFLKGGEEECGSGSCAFPVRGVGSEGAVYADPDLSFFFFSRLEGVSNPSIRVTQPTK